MKKLSIFAESKMFKEARENHKGLNWILEILVLFAVTIVALGVASIPSTIAMVVKVINDSEFQKAIGEILSGGSSDFASGITALIQKTTVAETLISLFSTVISAIIIILFCRIIQKRKPASMGFRKNGAFKEYILGAVIGIVQISLAVGLGLVSGTLKISLASNMSILILVFFAGFLIQGMSEEVLCRGYFMVSFARKHPIWLAVLLNSIYFGFLHTSNPGFGLMPMINLVLSGIAFSMIIVKRGNIWGACAMHSFWNFFQGNIYGISVSGTGEATSIFRVQAQGASILTGGDFGIEGSIFCMIIELLTIAFIVFILPRKKDEFVVE